MYETVVLVLIEEHPKLFGPPNNLERQEPWREQQEEEEGEEEDSLHQDDEEYDNWMFSLEKFHWAFALINSRHWHLPIPDQSTNPPETKENPPDADTDNIDNTLSDDHVSFTIEQPPASMPTDEWLDQQRELLKKEEEIESRSGGSDDEDTDHHKKANGDDGGGNVEYWPTGNSFLAPVADLLNFGPPCTRGYYNHTAQTFEIIATCPFRKGQEITFWYTDACQDVFVANYGFTMPTMVPKCVDYRQLSQQRRIRQLEIDLAIAYDDLDRMDRHVDNLYTALRDCHCENQTDTLSNNNDRRNPNRGGMMDASPPSNAPSRRRQNDDNNKKNNQEIGGSYTMYEQRQPGRNRLERGGSGDGGSNDARHAIRGGRSRRSGGGGGGGGSFSTKDPTTKNATKKKNDRSLSRKSDL
jgi:hypothetical protein